MVFEYSLDACFFVPAPMGIYRGFYSFIRHDASLIGFMEIFMSFCESSIIIWSSYDGRLSRPRKFEPDKPSPGKFSGVIFMWIHKTFDQSWARVAFPLKLFYTHDEYLVLPQWRGFLLRQLCFQHTRFGARPNDLLFSDAIKLQIYISIRTGPRLDYPRYAHT